MQSLLKCAPTVFNLVLRGFPVFKYANYCHIYNVTMLFPWNHNLHALKIKFVDLQNESFGICLVRTSCPKNLVFVEYSPMTDSYLQLSDCMNTTLD